MILLTDETRNTLPMVYHMTTTHNFIPGDRFTSIGIATKDTGGVIGEALTGGKTMLHWDSGNAREWSAESIAQWIRPAPITVGSWVRVDAPGWKGKTRIIGRDDLFLHFYGADGAKRFIREEFARAIAAPAPAQSAPFVFEGGVMRVNNERIAELENLLKDASATLETQQMAIDQAARRLAKWVKDAPPGYGTDESRAWLAQYAPDALPPTFKRGDLVWTGRVYGNARIITQDAETKVTVECMTNDGKIFIVPFGKLHAPQP